MNPDLFRADLAAKPAALRDLASALRVDNPWAMAGAWPGRVRLVLLGMGSSHYANAIAAGRLRQHGFDAVAVLASSSLLPRVDEDTVVVAVSASGGSAETLAAADHYAGTCPLVAITNVPGSAITGRAEATVDMRAGEERGGVACRSFQHTLALWLDLERRLTGSPDTARLLEHAADASADLLERADVWLPSVRDHLVGPDGTAFVAPAHRLSSAQQSALMLRECPRLPAIACETGDWSHVDVYLTKTQDYRMALLAGSPWEPELLRWTRERDATVVAIGADVADARATVRYRHDDDDDVRLLSEVMVAELVAADLWES